ncbi:MAG: PEP-CTERM sorting domain-containing protein [Phycisphaerae bacterium]|nr:PEP-CTERM sorting domain-containing protein [Phycisphaerae bacterium]
MKVKLLILLIIAVFCTQANCEQIAVMVQQTPADGGTVTPSVGVHNLDTGSAVTLTATPKAGYQFVYWLGDVADPTASTTMMRANSPRIIVAVFERVENEYVTPVANMQVSGGGSGLRGSAGDIVRQSGGAGGGKRPHKPHYPNYTPDEPEETDDFPVPEDNNDFPVPEVPEPATSLLLALGAMFGAWRRRIER